MYSENRVALYCDPLQPLSKGDANTIGQLTQDFNTVIVAITGANAPVTRKTPFTIEERIEMVKNVFGDRVRVVTVDEVLEGSEESRAQVVLRTIKEAGLPDPTDLWTNDENDVVDFKEFFYRSNPYKDVNPADESKYMVGNVRRWLHVVQSYSIVYPKQSELRSSIEKRDAGWQVWVPKRNIDLVGKSASL